MSRVVIFFASTALAKPLALALSGLLRDRMGTLLDARLWWKTIEPGNNTLPALIDQCKEADFAVVLLTPDDILMIQDERYRTPRDNCVFEAGLFTGALGANPKRCFLLISSDETKLPSDLNGVVHKKFIINEEVSENLRKAAEANAEQVTLPGDVRASLDSVAEAIVIQVQKYDAFMKLEDDVALPSLSKERLIEYECGQTGLCRVRDRSRVLVISDEPLELANAFAVPVLSNMRRGIRYDYVFHDSVKTAEKIIALVKSLAMAGIDPGTI